MTEDPAAALQTAIESAFERLRATRGAENYEAYDGQKITGWKIDTFLSKEYRDGPDLTTEYPSLILSDVGEIWQYAETTTEKQEAPWTFTSKDFLFKQERRNLVGGKGKPFSEIISTLDRCGW